MKIHFRKEADLEIEEDGLEGEVEAATAKVDAEAAAAALASGAPAPAASAVVKTGSRTALPQVGKAGAPGSKKKAAAEDEGEVAPRLSKLIFLQSTKCHKFDDAKPWQAYQMASFSEPKTFKILSSDAGFREFREYNSRVLSRIYPKGTRFDSSNYDPIVAWFGGCHVSYGIFDDCFDCAD